MGENPVERHTFHYSAAIRINYEVAGHGATPIVLLHGFAASLITWHDIRGFFPPERFRLYLLDLKGFGFSTKPRDGHYAPEDIHPPCHDLFVHRIRSHRLPRFSRMTSLHFPAIIKYKRAERTLQPARGDFAALVVRFREGSVGG